MPIVAVAALSALRPPPSTNGALLSRRAAVLSVGAAAATARSARADDSKTFVDKENGIQFDIPAAWTVSESELSGGRKLVVATDPSNIDFNAFIAFTPIAGDYSSLGSFGNLESVGATLLPQCNSGLCQLETDNIEGKMLDSVRLPPPNHAVSAVTARHALAKPPLELIPPSRCRVSLLAFLITSLGPLTDAAVPPVSRSSRARTSTTTSSARPARRSVTCAPSSPSKSSRRAHRPRWSH